MARQSNQRASALSTAQRVSGCRHFKALAQSCGIPADHAQRERMSRTAQDAVIVGNLPNQRAFAGTAGARNGSAHLHAGPAIP